MNNIILRYPERDLPVLNGYSDSFQRGQVHALVGESGSGKTTALKVIAGLLQPEEGEIQSWSGMKIAYVSQDQKLFARSIRENVTYGTTMAVTDAEIWTALERANLKDWVMSLPEKLDSVLVGGEDGISGGQLQRMNLAHLFCVCQDADLIILDEVLSALDPASREKLLDELKAFLDGKTAIIITHHSEMLKICHQVHEMKAATRPLERVSSRRQSGSHRFDLRMAFGFGSESFRAELAMDDSGTGRTLVSDLDVSSCTNYESAKETQIFEV